MITPGARLRAATAMTIVLALAGCSSNTSPTSEPGPSGSSAPIAVGSPTTGPDGSVVPATDQPLGTDSPAAGASGSPVASAAPSRSATPSASISPTTSAKPTASPKASAKPTASPVTAGPAVKFKVEGLVYQQRICYTLTVCTTFPPADYPRQLVKVTALDAQGRVAIGYTGTVTFTNPAFGGGNGGLADSTLTKGVGIFPVLEPKLTWKAQGEPWDSLCGLGGIALHVRDTVDPSIAGCENIAAGGAITLVHPDVYTNVTPTGCATGCLQEPTNTIVLDPGFLNPTITAAAPTQISITGETLQQQFYVQPVNIGVVTVAVGDTSNLTLCSQCTAGTQLLLQRSEVPLTVGSLVDYTNSLTPSNPATEVTWTPTDLQKCIGGFDYCFAIQEAQIFLNTTLGPTCYDDVARIYQVACLGG